MEDERVYMVEFLEGIAGVLEFTKTQIQVVAIGILVVGFITFSFFPKAARM